MVTLPRVIRPMRVCWRWAPRWRVFSARVSGPVARPWQRGGPLQQEGMEPVAEQSPEGEGLVVKAAAEAEAEEERHSIPVWPTRDLSRIQRF